MEFKQVIDIFHRVCNKHKDCRECPLYDKADTCWEFVIEDDSAESLLVELNKQ